VTEWIQAGGYAGDLQAAYDYYRAKGGSRAAEQFYERYRSCIEMITQHPASCAIRGHGWRQKPIPRSTYSVFYGKRGRYWMLVGIQSTVQDPDRIQALLLLREVAADEGA